jgi:DNA segregation ATPase FtsK/SpoIIIE, S-DNA-T family
MTDLHSGVNGANGATPDTAPNLHMFVPDSLTDLPEDTGPEDTAVPDGDAETMTVTAPAAGVSADAPDEDVLLGWSWADLTSTSTNRRVPIIPAWLGSPQARAATLRAIGDNLWYRVRFHAVRAPKYAAKTVLYAPIGAVRLTGRAIQWATAEQGNFALRQHAATTNDAYTWQSLNRVRARESRARWWVLIPAVVVAVLGLAILKASGVVPGFGWYLAEAVALALAARAGRPADQPITDRVSNAARFTRLTAEMVRNALLALNLSVMKEPGAIEFAHPGVHRDGPGWLARVNLPQGLEAVKVLEKRGALSSALRLPVDQVWPTAGPEHAGQVDLWVGYQPASKMGQPKWSLAAPNARTSVFDEHEFGTDERQRPIRTSLFARSFLVAGRPGSGKSYAARAVGTIALLDPTAELKVAEFKGTGDFLDWEPLCSTYVVGVDDDAFERGAAILRWALAEAERRGKRILAAKKRGEAPHGKATPELARRPGSGLHPITLIFDEVHELFAAIPETAKDAERLIKRARALNIHVVLATQIPDKTSLPPNVVRCVTNRWCLSVAGQTENDMILGTGAYKRGITGTVYRPEIDAGWGVMTGLQSPVSVHSHFPDPATATAIVAHATAMRGGKVVGSDDDLPAARDLLADLVAVSVSNGRHWVDAAPALVQHWPRAYANLTPEALSGMARAAGVSSVDVKIGRKTAKGYRLDAVRRLIADRVETDAATTHSDAASGSGE